MAGYIADDGVQNFQNTMRPYNYYLPEIDYIYYIPELEIYAYKKPWRQNPIGGYSTLYYSIKPVSIRKGFTTIWFK